MAILWLTVHALISDIMFWALIVLSSNTFFGRHVEFLGVRKVFQPTSSIRGSSLSFSSRLFFFFKLQICKLGWFVWRCSVFHVSSPRSMCEKLTVGSIKLHWKLCCVRCRFIVDARCSVIRRIMNLGSSLESFRTVQ